MQIYFSFLQFRFTKKKRFTNLYHFILKLAIYVYQKQTLAVIDGGFFQNTDVIATAHDIRIEDLHMSNEPILKGRVDQFSPLSIDYFCFIFHNNKNFSIHRYRSSISNPGTISKITKTANQVIKLIAKTNWQCPMSIHSAHSVHLFLQH